MQSKRPFHAVFATRFALAFLAAVTGIVGSQPAQTQQRTSAQTFQRCVDALTTRYQIDHGTPGRIDSPDTAQVRAIRAECSRPPASIAEAARRNINLFTYPDVVPGFRAAVTDSAARRALTELIEAGGPAEGEANGDFAIYNICRPHECATVNASIIVDLTTKAAAVCRYDSDPELPVPLPVTWYFAGQEPVVQTDGDALGCPVDLAGTDASFYSSWREAQRQRAAAQGAAAAKRLNGGSGVPPAPGTAAPGTPSRAQLSRCFEEKLEEYRLARNAGRLPPPNLTLAWEEECKSIAAIQRPVPTAPAPLSSAPASASPLGASAERAAQAGQNLFALPEIAALYQTLPARDKGPQWPMPKGRFTSYSDGTFALTRVCEDTGCGAQKGVLVEVATGAIVFCSFSIHDQPWGVPGSAEMRPRATWRNFPGSQLVRDMSTNQCPSRVAEVDPRFLQSWQYSQQRQVERLQTPAAPAQPVPPLSGVEAARVARARQSLFTLPAIRALYLGYGNPSKPPQPQGRFDSEANDRFAMTRVCENAGCVGQTTVIVDIAANDAVICEHGYVESAPAEMIPSTWISRAGSYFYETARSCPHRLADLTPKALLAWQGDQRKRGGSAIQDPVPTFSWNGMQQRAQISGQCVKFWLGGVEQPCLAGPAVLDISVPSREELTQNLLPTATFRGPRSARPVILGFSRARRVVAADGTTTITYRASKVNQIPDGLARELAGSGKSIDCTYRYVKAATNGAFACGAVPNAGSFREAFMFDIQFAPDSATYTTPTDEGPRLHALMLAAWEALGAK